MSQKNASRKPRKRERRFASCLRDFLTPALFRQVYRLVSKRSNRRWTLQPLLYVLLCMTWCLGDSQPERFETARAFCVALRPKRRRPGKTHQGFQKALERLPCSILRAVATLFRKHLLVRFGALLKSDGWIVFGCDGTRLRTPHCEELAKRLGNPGGDGKTKKKRCPSEALSTPYRDDPKKGIQAKEKAKEKKKAKDPPPPQVWLTVLVHLASGVPWSWLPGKGDASERNHLARMARLLPLAALIVTDAGYQGYQLARELLAVPLNFLMRVSSQTVFYVPHTDRETTQDKHRQVTPGEMEKWTDGEVYYWPTEAQKEKDKPIKVRLIRIAAKKKKNDVWLVTSVLDPTRLSVEMASRFYRMRWENEGFFRTYKQTMNKVKLSGRTVKSIHREVLGSMLAMQVLMAQGVAARAALRRKQGACSARQLVLLVRQEMGDTLRGRTRQGFLDRAARCEREQRNRTSKKQKREWPGRKDPKTIKPPRIRLLSEELKLLFQQCLEQAA